LQNGNSGSMNSLLFWNNIWSVKNIKVNIYQLVERVFSVKFLFTCCIYDEAPESSSLCSAIKWSEAVGNKKNKLVWKWCDDDKSIIQFLK
jgi:hypothetical protein